MSFEFKVAKKKLLQNVLHFRIQSLEASCEEKEKQLNEERGKFSKLKEDFKYNLKLLEERDAELDRYDASFAGMSLDCNERRLDCLIYCTLNSFSVF